MGTYICSAEEIAGIMEDLNLEGNIEGDFYEEEFIKGAEEYLHRLRLQGAFIYSEKADNIKKMCKTCGGLKSKTCHKEAKK